MKEFRMRAFFGILGLAGAGFLVSSVSTVGCGSDNGSKGGSTGSAGSTGAAGTTGNAGTTGSGNSGGDSGGNSGGGSGGDGGASGPATGCMNSQLPPAPAPLIADFAVSDGGEPVPPIGGVYKFANPSGAVTPTESVMGGGWKISLQAPGMTGAEQYVGVGIYFNGSADGKDCIDATQYTGIKFDLTGTIGGTGCSLSYSTEDSGHKDSTISMPDPKASGPMGSYAPSVPVTVPTGASPTVMVPFTSQMSGVPATGIVKDKLVGAQWQFTLHASTTAAPTNCDVSITIDNVSFY